MHSYILVSHSYIMWKEIRMELLLLLWLSFAYYSSFPLSVVCQEFGKVPPEPCQALQAPFPGCSLSPRGTPSPILNINMPSSMNFYFCLRSVLANCFYACSPTKEADRIIMFPGRPHARTDLWLFYSQEQNVSGTNEVMEFRWSKVWYWLGTALIVRIFFAAKFKMYKVSTF